MKTVGKDYIITTLQELINHVKKLNPLYEVRVLNEPTSSSSSSSSSSFRFVDYLKE
jgi:hypothetical protein